MFPKLLAAVGLIVEAVLKSKEIYDRIRFWSSQRALSRIIQLNRTIRDERDPLRKRRLQELQLRLTREYDQKYQPHRFREGE